ncbi:lysis protein [Pseudomonas sp. S2_A02]
MSVLDLIPAAVRPWLVALVLLLIAGAAAGSAWTIQDWRYGKTLADRARESAEAAQHRVEALLAGLEAEQGKRLALEQRLSANEQTHYKELIDAQTNQARLRDRLATSDLRLSVLLAEDSGGGCSVPADATAGGMVHGGARARLDPAHAQRIVAITDAGDQGLIALAACQAYARELSR